jgi:hypothetical protein
VSNEVAAVRKFSLKEIASPFNSHGSSATVQKALSNQISSKKVTANAWYL